jgi:hypothetical protein
VPFIGFSIANVYLVIEASITYMQLFRIDSHNRAIFLVQLLNFPSIFSLQINVKIKFIPNDGSQRAGAEYDN